jgi:hypothetical protein
LRTYDLAIAKQIGDLPPEEMGWVLGHPTQVQTVEEVGQFLADLRLCNEAEDFVGFQMDLLRALYRVEERRSRVRRNWSRVRKGKDLTADAPALPDRADPTEADAWRLEDVVLERAARQLRAVGDALAWRASGFDRRYVVALAQNASSGPIANKEGLDYEVGAVESIWRDTGHFALLHDITGCLRIGDVTEFGADGHRHLHEIKKSRSGRDPKQAKRMSQAVAAFNRGALLPGSDSQMVSVDIEHATHLDILGDLLDLTLQRGVRGAKVPGGRVTVVTDLVGILQMSGGDPESWLPKMNSASRSAKRRAGFPANGHELTYKSADWAARSPLAVPLGVYPIKPEDAAAIICDRVIFEVALSAELLAERARDAGYRSDVLLPDAHGNLSSSEPIIRLGRGGRWFTLHTGSLQELLPELLAMDAFFAGLATMFERVLVPPYPLLMFEHEERTWR